MPTNELYLDTLSMILKKNHEILLQKLNINNKIIDTKATHIMHSDEYYNMSTSCSPSVSYTSCNNSFTHSERNVTFTSLIG